MPEALDRIAELASLVDVPIQVDGGIGDENAARVREAGASLLVAGSAVFADPAPAEAYRRLARGPRMSLERALALVAAAPRSGYPNPTVGAVVVAADGAILGEGVSEPAGGQARRGGRARRGRRRRRGRDALRDHGAVRAPRPHAAVRRRDPRRGRSPASSPHAPTRAPRRRGGAEALRAAGVEVELLDLPEAQDDRTRPGAPGLLAGARTSSSSSPSRSTAAPSSPAGAG